METMKREMKIMYMLDHKNLLKLYNHFEDNQWLYLIMELAKGGLEKELKRVKKFSN